MRFVVLGALVCLLGACGGNSEASDQVEPCFRDLAARYEQAVNAIEPALRENVLDIARSVTAMVDAARNRDVGALKDASEVYTMESAQLKMAGDAFFAELEEAHALDVECP